MVCQKERNTDPILEAEKHVVSNPQTNQGTRADAVRHTKPWWATGINAASDDERGGGGGEWKEDGGTACLGSRTVAVGGGEVERGVPKGRKEGEVCDGWAWEWRQKRPTQIADRGPQTANQTRPGAIKNNKHNKTSDASALTATVMTTAWAAAGEQEDGGQVAVASKQASVPSLQQRPVLSVGTRGNQPMQALQNGEPASPQAFLMEGVRERGDGSHSPSPAVGHDRPRGLGPAAALISAPSGSTL